jgi:hypothetical protein
MSLTLSATEILVDVLDAFKKQFPMLTFFSTDFSAAAAVLNQQVLARIAQLPSVQSYDSTSGYDLNTADSKSLLVDVPVTLNQHKHVPVKILYLDRIASKIDLYNQSIGNIGWVLGKSVIDYVLGLCTATNFSGATTATIANTNRDTLSTITLNMNANGAASSGRYGIVSSLFFNSLDSDIRIASGDYHGQMRDGSPYGHLVNIAGFENIVEYPDTPSGSNQTAFFGDKRAAAVVTRLPSDIQNVADIAGIPSIAGFDVVEDEASGLALLGIKWMKPGTFDVIVTATLLYGAVAGNQGGSSGVITDKAGWVVKSA